MGAMLLWAVENVKSGSERPEGAGHSLLPPPGPNRDPTPSMASSLARPISNCTQFMNCTLRPLGEAEVAWYELGRSLESIPWNRPLEKAYEDGRGDLGG